MMLPCIGQIYIIFPFPRTPPDAEQQGGKDGIGSNWLFALASHTQELQINQQRTGTKKTLQMFQKLSSAMLKHSQCQESAKSMY